jgi:pilus assembly protein Flp/PilA
MTACAKGSTCLACAIDLRIAANPGAAGVKVFEVIHSRERTMLSILRRLMRNHDGATAIEYTLIASLIAVAAIAAMGSVGTKVNGVLTNVANSMK